MTTLSTQYQSYKVLFLIIKVLWATKALLLPTCFCLAYPSLHPPTLAFVSMDAPLTSFHTPYSYWPPSGVTTYENHYNFHVNGS
jgi:hypothetical protein